MDFGYEKGLTQARTARNKYPHKYLCEREFAGTTGRKCQTSQTTGTARYRLAFVK